MNTAEEENAVRQLGEVIGYGRIMQLCVSIWNYKQPGGALTIGPCISQMVPCPHPDSGRDMNGHCDWCCGSGLVTRKVLTAIAERGRTA